MPAKTEIKSPAVKTTNRRRKLVSTTQIAEMAGVNVNVVANWKRRYDSFPEACTNVDVGHDRYDRSEVIDWLRNLAKERVSTAKTVCDNAKVRLSTAEKGVADAKALADRIKQAKK